jgi:hypothetical protein
VKGRTIVIGVCAKSEKHREIATKSSQITLMIQAFPYLIQSPSTISTSSPFSITRHKSHPSTSTISFSQLHMPPDMSHQPRNAAELDASTSTNTIGAKSSLAKCSNHFTMLLMPLEPPSRARIEISSLARISCLHRQMLPYPQQHSATQRAMQLSKPIPLSRSPLPDP